MYLGSERVEGLFLTKRRGTVKLAIEHQTTIIPTMFFGNSRIFHVPTAKGADTWLSRISRQFRVSIVAFYGRLFLPIPLRVPLSLVTGKTVKVPKLAKGIVPTIVSNCP